MISISEEFCCWVLVFFFFPWIILIKLLSFGSKVLKTSWSNFPSIVKDFGFFLSLFLFLWVDLKTSSF